MQIENENDYKKVLERLEILFDAKKGTPEGDELDRLGNAIIKYEEENHST